jgi:hypothetical protein
MGVSLFCQGLLYCQKDKSGTEEFVGEFCGWNTGVSLDTYYVVKGAIMVFGTRWGAQPQTEQELEDRVWEQLVLSSEAFRRNIKVEDKELNEEIDKMLSSEKVKFERLKNRDAYLNWVRDKTKEPVNFFENQLRHLLQLENLRKQVLESFKPTVTQEEAHQEFLNEYNTLELELVQFDELEKAEDFYLRMQKPQIWEDELKKNPKFAQHPGFVSLEFLIDMWKIPKDDLYKMLDLEVNSIYPPIPVYKGYGVIRILKKRIADEADFAKRSEYYFKQVGMIKKYDELKDWLKRLKQEADIKLYPKK